MKLKPIPTPPDLKAETVAVLLGGWTAHPPAGVDPGPHGFCGAFLDLYEPAGAGMIRLWRAHEAWLRDVARRWGWSPRHVGPDGHARFYAEHLAAGLPAFELDDADVDA